MRGFVLFGLLFLSGCVSHQIDARKERFSSVDSLIFQDMFRGQVDYTYRRPWVIGAVCHGFSPEMPKGPEREFLQRVCDLAIGFNDLTGLSSRKDKVDPVIKAEYYQILDRLIAELGARPANQYVVRTRAYSELARSNVLAKVVGFVDQGGSRPVSSIPENWRSSDPEWDKQKPSIIAYYDRPKANFPCSEIFWFCPTSGTISDDPGNLRRGGQLTINTWGVPRLEACLLRLNQLLKTEPEFRGKYNLVVSKIQKDAEMVDPADPKAMNSFLKDVYQTMEQEGISQRLQNSAE